MVCLFFAALSCLTVVCNDVLYCVLYCGTCIKVLILRPIVRNSVVAALVNPRLQTCMIVLSNI